jgi:hypothetical protein
MVKVVLLGLHPDVVDFTAVPGLTKEKLAASLSAQEAELRALGFDATWILFDRGETAERVVAAALDAKAYDVVLIGAGVRAIPAHFILFEKLINLVHERAPKAKICFNTKPDDTREAVLRWTGPRA